MGHLGMGHARHVGGVHPTKSVSSGLANGGISGTPGHKLRMSGEGLRDPLSRLTSISLLLGFKMAPCCCKRSSKD